MFNFKIFYHTRRGSAILIALITLILVTAVTNVFLDKVLRFSRSINGIERSNISYYNALSLIEERLMSGSFTKYDPWKVTWLVDTGSTFSGRIMTVSTGSNTVPSSGLWSSSFDSDYNLITLGEPVQLVIPDGINSWNSVHFEFRVPIIGSNTNTGVDATYFNSGFILWTFGNSGATLFASGETNIFRWLDINTPMVTIDSKNGVTNSGSAETFWSFYLDPNFVWWFSPWEKCAGYTCTLKLSLIRPVPLDDGRLLPFLEYKITFPWGTSIPNQRMTIQSRSYVNGFVRETTTYLPQITTNTALDFAVLQ